MIFHERRGPAHTMGCQLGKSLRSELVVFYLRCKCIKIEKITIFNGYRYGARDIFEAFLKTYSYLPPIEGRVTVQKKSREICVHHSQENTFNLCNSLDCPSYSFLLKMLHACAMEVYGLPIACGSINDDM